MSKRTLIVVAVLMVVFGATLLASVPPSGTWEECLTVDLKSFSKVSSSLTVSHTFGGFKATSTSDFYLPSFIWQEFRATGSLGVFGIQGTLLFGPSTATYIYGQLIVKTQITGIDFGFYTAQVTDAVLGGPADGGVIRLAKSIGAIHIVNLFELGARIEDEEFKGITIYHAAPDCTNITRPTPLSMLRTDRIAADSLERRSPCPGSHSDV